MFVGSDPAAGVATPGETSIPDASAVSGEVTGCVTGSVLEELVPPATEAMASGVADALGGAG